MPKVKVLEVDLSKGKSEIKEREIELPATVPLPKGVGLKDIEELIKLAKSKGWI